MINYHMPPPKQCVPVEQLRKYFYVILFIRSYVYNIKGQAIIFKRKSIQSLEKLIRDFDQTYLHTSMENSYDKCHMHKYSNVDFIVKYTDSLEEVLDLIDENAYVIKLSWQKNVEIPRPYPPQPPFPMPPYNPDKFVIDIPNCCPPPPPPPYPQPHIKQDPKFVHLLMDQLNNINNTLSQLSGHTPTPTPIPPTGFTNNYEHVRITNVSGYIVTVANVDQQTDQIISGTERQIDTSIYGYNNPNNSPNFEINDDCMLFDGLYLIKIDDENIPQSIIDNINDLLHRLDG